ncbi:MAG: hypothetical protein V9E89_09725 [Ilumatobacteraceae bacterium]
MDSENVDVAVDFAAALGERRQAYERLLDDALQGLPRRFAREDVVEQTWRVVQPLLDNPGPVLPYFRGSVGAGRVGQDHVRGHLVPTQRLTGGGHGRDRLGITTTVPCSSVCTVTLAP